MNEDDVLPPLHHFLLIFDRDKDELILNKDFGEDDDAAVKAYTEAEWEYMGQTQYDVLLVGAESIETVKINHSNYFPGAARRRIVQTMNQMKKDLGLLAG